MEGRAVRKGERLYQVVAPHYCAGFVVDNYGLCIRAAPILRWAINRSISHLLRYLVEQKKFTVIDVR